MSLIPHSTKRPPTPLPSESERPYTSLDELRRAVDEANERAFSKQLVYTDVNDVDILRIRSETLARVLEDLEEARARYYQALEARDDSTFQRLVSAFQNRAARASARLFGSPTINTADIPWTSDVILTEEDLQEAEQSNLVIDPKKVPRRHWKRG